MASSSMRYKPARLASFDPIVKPKKLAKPGWPLSPTSHPHLTPQNLATAGFYHYPGSSSDTHDTVKCFLCALELGGWDEADDPFEEHVKRGGCAWAETLCAIRVDKKQHEEGGRLRTIYPTPESLPQSAESALLREQTFGASSAKWWPHKQKAGWLPTTKSLARAGFIFTPTEDEPDCVTCPLCVYEVVGWEATDDPWATHNSKMPQCPFFTATAPVQDVAEKASKNGSRSTKSQTSKRSKRATTAAASQADLESQSAPPEADDAESVAPVAPSEGGRRARVPKNGEPSSPPKPKATRGRKKKTLTVDVAESEAGETDGAPVQDDDVGSRVEPHASEMEEATKKGKGKGKAAGKGRGRKTKLPDEAEPTQATAVETAQVEELVDDEPTPQSKPSKPSKPSKTSSKSSRKTEKPIPTLPPIEATQPLSLLEAFVNLPPSSPAPPTPRPKHVTSKASRPSKHQNLDRHQLERSVEEGAREARKVIEQIVASPLPAFRAGLEGKEEGWLKEGLTEEQKKMTLEDLVRFEMKRRCDGLRADGEEMIGKWEERTREARKRIEAI